VLCLLRDSFVHPVGLDALLEQAFWIVSLFGMV